MGTCITEIIDMTGQPTRIPASFAVEEFQADLSLPRSARRASITANNVFPGLQLWVLADGLCNGSSVMRDEHKTHKTFQWNPRN